MNITLLSLTLSSLHSSPFLSLPGQINKINFKVKNIYCSNFFGNFLRTGSINEDILIKNSHFTGFLDRVVYSNQENFFGEKFSEQQRTYKIENTRLENCVFSNIKTSGGNGGAIFTIRNLIAKNCEFNGITGHIGACIYTCGKMDLSNTIFANSKGYTSGAIATQQNDDSFVKVKYCKFFNLNSEFISALYLLMEKNGFTTIKYNNFTKLYADNCVGCGEIKESNLLIDFCIFSNIEAKVHNGCIVTRELNSFSCCNSVFYKCKHNSNIMDTASVFLLYSTPSRSKISECSFIYCKSANSFAINVIGGNELILSHLCFTGQKGKEISESNIIKSEDNIFLSECLDSINKVENEFRKIKIGNINANVNHFDYRLLAFQTFISLVAALLLSLLIVSRKRIFDCLEKGKTPVAFN